MLKQDKQLLERQVAKTICHSQGFRNDIKCEHLIDVWAWEKRRLIDQLGGLVIRTDNLVTYGLSDKTKAERFTKFLNKLHLLLHEHVDDMYYSHHSILLWLEKNEASFWDNFVSYPIGSMVFGSKLLKNFKFFISDEDLLRAAQDLASTFIQENKLEGYLYLSVHPMDYLTSSENNFKWRSCHALDGDYRGGNLSYMCDDVTIVAYVAPAEQRHLACLPEGEKWYDKKWRTLVHIHPLDNVIYFGRSYPFECPEVLDDILSVINKHWKNKFETEVCYASSKTMVVNGRNYNLENNYLILGGNLVDFREIIDNPGLNYNDLVFSHVYSPPVAFGKNLKENNFWHSLGIQAPASHWHKAQLTMEVGAPVKCPCCGDEPIYESEQIICEYCMKEAEEENIQVCGWCGRRIYESEEPAVMIDGILTCAECAELMKKENK